MVLELLVAKAAESALKKPLEELYQAARGATRDALKRLQNASAIRGVYAKAAEVGTVRTIASRHPVSIRQIYYPARIVTKSGSMRVDSIEDLSNGANRNIVILGTVGQGKSVFLKYLSLTQVDSGSGLPVFLELRNVAEHGSLSNLLKSQLQHLGFGKTIDDELVEALLSRELVTLYLDGYDEVKRTLASALRAEVHQLASKYPLLRIVVSSRPSAISQELDRLTGFSYLEISPLSGADFEPFMQRIGVEDATRARLLVAIEKSPTKIRSLLTTPLMLTLVVTACGTRPALPDSLPDFYDALFGVMVATHDETKPGYIRDKSTGFSNTQLQSFFKAFSFISRDEAGTTSLTPKEFSESHRKTIEITGLECSVEQFRDDITDVVCLMAKDGLNIAFVHKSIQEYFASAFIADLDDEEVVKELYGRLRLAKFREWQQELDFLADTDAYRHKKYYLLPSLEATLKMFGYSKEKNGTVVSVRSGFKVADASLHKGQIMLAVDLLSKVGHSAYMFRVFEGIQELVCPHWPASDEEESPEKSNPHHPNLKQFLRENPGLEKAVIVQARKNLSDLRKTRDKLEADLDERRGRLLNVIKLGRRKKS